ncbi:MAG TPA: hypothetical protein VHD63_09725 [Ktedonobacteraceae bacterium]|nr:hypothetical protein [Ktedonobacteraceae bacterium]
MKEHFLEPAQTPRGDDGNWYKLLFYEILAFVREHSTCWHSWEHGEAHWQLVAQCGLRLSQRVANCDAWVVLLFAVFHDAMRCDDGDDWEHGQRASELVHQMAARHLRSLSRKQEDMLATACLLHNRRMPSAHPTIGTCFDADRLNYPRGGTSLDTSQLSTSAARDPHMIAWSARQLLRPAPGWEKIWQQFVDGKDKADEQPFAFS